jgi:hypothetical protein
METSTVGIVIGRVRWYSIIFLVVIAACLAEFLTGSTPLLAPLTSPIGFAFNLGLYGGGAILIREAVILWKKSWGAVFLLGCAYAVGEEGFAAKTMIEPISPIIGNQLYTHWLGINWIPLVGLTIFHAAFSIAVPILLVELLFPETKGHRLVGNFGLAFTMLVYGLTVFLLTAYVGPHYVPSLGVEIFLIIYASC